jgi:hypothetical protein
MRSDYWSAIVAYRVPSCCRIVIDQHLMGESPEYRKTHQFRLHGTQSPGKSPESTGIGALRGSIGVSVRDVQSGDFNARVSRLVGRLYPHDRTDLARRFLRKTVDRLQRLCACNDGVGSAP